MKLRQELDEAVRRIVKEECAQVHYDLELAKLGRADAENDAVRQAEDKERLSKALSHWMGVAEEWAQQRDALKVRLAVAEALAEKRRQEADFWYEFFGKSNVLLRKARNYCRGNTSCPHVSDILEILNGKDSK